MAYRSSVIKTFDTGPFGSILLPLNNVVGAAGLVTGYSCVNCIQQGTAFYNRIGSKVFMKAIATRYIVYTTDKAAIVRATVIYDHSPNRSYPAIASIFQVNASGAILTGNEYKYTPNDSRFEILYDCYHACDLSKIQRHYEMSIPINKEAQYVGTLGTIADITTGAIYTIFSTSDAYGAVPIIRNVTTRVLYYD